jgi:hypothetical protein
MAVEEKSFFCDNNPSLRPKTAQYLFRSNRISGQGMFQLQFLLAWPLSPSRLAMVGERGHAFSYQQAIQACLCLTLRCNTEVYNTVPMQKSFPVSFSVH